MAEKTGIAERWNNLQPSKGFVFFAFVAGIVLTLLVGFKSDLIVTRFEAEDMVQAAAVDARADLAAAVCFDRFMHAADADQRIAKLKKADDWMRGSVIEEAGWVTLAGAKQPVEAAGERCAKRILKATSAEAKAKK